MWRLLGIDHGKEGRICQKDHHQDVEEEVDLGARRPRPAAALGRAANGEFRPEPPGGWGAVRLLRIPHWVQGGERNFKLTL